MWEFNRFALEFEISSWAIQKSSIPYKVDSGKRVGLVYFHIKDIQMAAIVDID